MATWKEIDGTYGYMVSSEGEVYCQRSQRMLVQGMSRRYKAVSIRYLNGAVRRVTVANLIAEAFLGKKPHGYQTHHINGDRLDDRLENIEYMRASEHHRLHCKINRRGEENHKAKLTESNILVIRGLENLTYKQIGKIFNIHAATVGKIRRGQVWSHVALSKEGDDCL